MATQREAQQKHYYANRASEIRKAYARKQANKKRLRAIIVEAKRVPCADCGGEWPSYVMDFHHLADKDCTVAIMVNRNVSVERLRREISKCIVLCANCHRLRTWAEQCGLEELANSPDSESGAF